MGFVILTGTSQILGRSITDDYHLGSNNLIDQVNRGAILTIDDPSGTDHDQAEFWSVRGCSIITIDEAIALDVIST